MNKKIHKKEVVSRCKICGRVLLKIDVPHSEKTDITIKIKCKKCKIINKFRISEMK